MLDFVWHQRRLKTYLENEAATNRPAAELAHELAEKSREFWELANTWTAVAQLRCAGGIYPQHRLAGVLPD